jgi:hypothetical protein
LRALGKLLVKETATQMKEAYLSRVTSKKDITKDYVNRCTTKISTIQAEPQQQNQSRPHRKMQRKDEKMLAVVMGWRVRRIMLLKEVKMRIAQIYAYQDELRHGDLNSELIRGIMLSAKTTKIRLSELIDRLQLGGAWLNYVDRTRPVRSPTVKRISKTGSSPLRLAPKTAPNLLNNNSNWVSSYTSTQRFPRPSVAP